MRYAVITPARDEAENLPRLAACLASQTTGPRSWIIVDNGSTDATLELAQDMTERHDWVDVLSIPGAASVDRGAPVVRALQAAVAALAADPPDIIVNVDADISFESDYFEQLLARFGSDPKLGIASGSGYEFDQGRWRQRHVTGSTVWGASRAYRWACLQEILPLEERVGWDGVDEFKANARGWRTVAFEELPFHHHRPEGHRDGPTWRARWNQGHAAWYVGYRPWYLIARALWHMRRDPAALGMVFGYAVAGLTREPQNPDKTALAYLRQQQSWRNLRLRAHEATGRRQGTV